MQDAKANGKPPHVLVVEDEAIIRLMITEQLRDAGLAVTEAGSADEAKCYVDAGNAVDLLFTDVRMPGTMNGLELARHVRSHHPAMPIVITSGFVGRAHAEAVGVFLPKPYAFEAATEIVLRALGIQ